LRASCAGTNGRLIKAAFDRSLNSLLQARTLKDDELLFSMARAFPARDMVPPAGKTVALQLLSLRAGTMGRAFEEFADGQRLRDAS